MPKVLHCKDVTAMDTCGFAVQGDLVDEILEHVVIHGKSRHGFTDTDTPELMALARSRIQDVPARRPSS